MEVSFLSDVGQKRNSNQDYAQTFLNQKGYLLALLADGMGGHKAGDVASRQTVEDIGKAWEVSDISDCELATRWLIKQIQNENQRIHDLGKSTPELSGMGTTIVAVCVIGDQFALAHVGDSRMYLLREGELIQLTEDHSLVNELVKTGEITPEMAINHPRKNILTRSIGMPGLVEVDVTSHFLSAHDYLLLCSDGLTNMLSDAEIKQIIEDYPTMKERVATLVEGANFRGGLDNITAILIHYGGEANV
ncbi:MULTISPECIES: Stp1/IreP family PP2C-type Ser/Thr phosphatase [Enterococcus]|uniref:protein-serine/threonine phosphatase n=1 Tax=Enterococcus sulfureus ATCC 49903 TaxID=1140003 RepID=S0L4Y1_9ENTE|nr:Stp1/IreP family PP2C-type Ser/Thr phosphatase [Enterococcus sulfureus]EOT46561.1 hypothetical protein OMY_01710 [Enterococcus sulfureus ATCC 49903]EOT86127.1 hypothetical protein I573_00880 [Enterococcus sulfureus ATCC 49903]